MTVRAVMGSESAECKEGFFSVTGSTHIRQFVT